MIKVALIRKDGTVASVVSPAVDTLYTDGETYGDLLAVHIQKDAKDAEVINGWVWDGDWVAKPPQPTIWHLWSEGSWRLNESGVSEAIRMERDHRLGLTDWTQFNDSPLTKAQATKWRTYRQQLRDITTQGALVPEDVVWPVSP